LQTYAPMKKLLIPFIIAFGFPAISFAQQYGWKDIGANIPGDSLGHDLSDVFFVSDNEGWITSSTHAEIYHTTDGGETFEIQIVQYDCEAVHMINELEGYSGGDNGRVYHTTDGGLNWAAIGTIGQTLTDIFFAPEADTGYACGLNGTIAYITSSGVTIMESGINGDLSSLSFPENSSYGKVCGGSIIMTFFNGIWGGDLNSYPSGGYNDVFMVDNQTGWAVGTSIIIHTTDGINWFEQTNPASASYNDVFFFDENSGYTVGGTGTIIHTNDGGENWNIVASGLTNNTLRALHFTSSYNGYVVGHNRTLLKYGEVSGIGENSHSFAFDLFPNPADESVRIHCSEFNTAAGTVEILTLEGKTVQKRTVSKGNEAIELDLKGLAAGIYLCRISIGTKTASRKLIIE